VWWFRGNFVSTELHEALEAFARATLCMDRDSKKDPLIFMEVAAVAYCLFDYRVRSIFSQQDDVDLFAQHRHSA
jgi:hypothetical protein